ncbi:MAG: SGNH/GDSL hydrolase family protein [Dongiaceae bacterium]
MSGQIILLGDSIFDNAAYLLEGQRDVAAQLRDRAAKKDWRVELRAIDGSKAGDVAVQVSRRPIDTGDVLVVSAGGNDALGHIAVLNDPSQLSAAEFLKMVHDIREAFRVEYRAMLDLLASLGRSLIVCTIYNPRFPDAEVQVAAEAGLSVFNDVIAEEALRRGLPVIDLRQVCNEDAHFANEIEPSELGGARIAEAIADRVFRL